MGPELQVLMRIKISKTFSRLFSLFKCRKANCLNVKCSHKEYNVIYYTIVCHSK